ncbi:Auxin-induced protein [Quillaja saponaria]|uniref:Auxin-induced protein n=1 Tax=Quillaja saponaria TaxID=32244 RepID=A0AAD7Q3E7_QUISA|nr:Auxin-induced protein [Quillaja saponaria]
MPKKAEVVDARKRTPKGHFVVYVGSEMTRFVVPTCYLKSPVFQQLLEKAADEHGFGNKDGIVLPCEAFTFQRLISYLTNKS